MSQRRSHTQHALASCRESTSTKNADAPLLGSLLHLPQAALSPHPCDHSDWRRAVGYSHQSVQPNRPTTCLRQWSIRSNSHPTLDDDGSRFCTHTRTVLNKTSPASICAHTQMHKLLLKTRWTHPHGHEPLLGSLPRRSPAVLSPHPCDHCDWQRKVGCSHQPVQPYTTACVIP